MEAVSRRPLDTPFKQQRLNAWQPILTPTWVIGTFVLIGLLFLPIGFVLLEQSNSIVEISHQYDGSGTPDAYENCMINRTNTGTQKGITCDISFTPDSDMEAPIYVYYQLDNFYQNHRRYVKSLSFEQLRGIPNGITSDCDPLTTVTIDGVTSKLNPCGLIANSLFNDVITSETVPMSETGIAWDSDVNDKFKQPEGFKTEACTSCSDGGCVADSTWKIYVDPDDATKCTKYHYPNDETTQYLYESYPMTVSPLEGVKNEHFIVWMRTAGLPIFRKLYGIIEQDVKKGETITFKVTPNFSVSNFKGKKSLVISTASWFGGKNPFLGQSYIAVGTICLMLAVGFGVKHTVNPRKLGDTRYLVWKDA